MSMAIWCGKRMDRLLGLELLLFHPDVVGRRNPGKAMSSPSELSSQAALPFL